MGGSNPAQVVSPLEVKLIPLRENQRVNLAAVERPRIPKRSSSARAFQSA